MRRLNYLDGLKGFCAISVCIFHFLLIFVIDGYVGWKAPIEAINDPFSYYFANFPYSILTNNSFPLYIFFAIISFLPSYQFFKNKDEEKVKSKAILRYFRFLPIIVILCIITYLMVILNLCPIEKLFKITHNPWALALIADKYTILEVFKIVFFTGYIEGTQLISPLWCLDYMFLGSMLTYLVLLINSKIKNKYILYGLLIIFFFFIDQNYLAFIAGIIVGDILSKEFYTKKVHGIIYIIIGCIIGLFPLVLLPKFFNIVTLYAIGAFLIILGTHQCFKENKILNNKFIGFLGKESLSFVIVQMMVLQSLNVFFYVTFYELGLNIYINLIINFLINGTLSVLLTYLCHKTITPLTNLLCNKVKVLLIK